MISPTEFVAHEFGEKNVMELSNYDGTAVIQRIAKPVPEGCLVQQTKIRSMLQKIATLAAAPQVEAKSSDECMGDKASPSGFYPQEKMPDNAISN
eukprot:3561892-Ditylum_brightwellii.AAC.1